MDEKIENKNGKPVLSKAKLVFIFIIAVIPLALSMFNIYLEIRRQFICNRMATKISTMSLQTVQNPTFDINDYILQKEVFENTCLERTGLRSYFWAFVSFWFLFWFPSWAITFFGKHPEKAQAAGTKI